MLIRSGGPIRLRLLATFSLVTMFVGVDGESGQDPFQAMGTKPCDWTLLDQSPLTAPGIGPVFIDVTSVIDDGSERAIVGPQVLVWDDSNPEAPLTRGSAVGLIHRDTEEDTLIPAPEGFQQASTVDGARLGDGRWLLVWVEAHDRGSLPGADGLRTVTAVWQGVFDGVEWEEVRRIPMETDPADVGALRLRVFRHDTRVYAVLRGREDGFPSDFLLVLEREPDGTWSERRAQVGYTPAFSVAPPLIVFTHNEWPPGATLPHGAISSIDVTAEDFTVTRRAEMESQNPAITLAVRTATSGREYLWHALPSTPVGPVLQGVAEGRTEPDSIDSLAEYASMPGAILAHDHFPFLWFRPMLAEGNGSATSFDLIAIHSFGEPPTVLRTALDTPFVPQFANPALLDDDGRTFLFGGVEAAGRLVTVMMLGQLTCS